MTTATLTWSQSYWGSAAAGTTVADSFAALYSSLDAADANADFPWQICSSDLVHTSTRYITLKRKDASPGRILFLFAVNTTDGQWNTQIQLSTAVPSNHLVVCYRDGATSDTPVNMRNSSGAIFTSEVQATSTPVTTSQTSSLVAGGFWEVAANEDMLIAYEVDSAHLWSVISSEIYLAGRVLVDPAADMAHAGALLVKAASWAPTPTVNATSSVGLLRIGDDGTTVEHWGKVVEMDSSFLATQGRNLAAKKVYFPPIQLASFQAPTGSAAVKYQLRQISFNITPLAGREELSDGVNVFATSIGSGISATAWWLLNFKLNA